MISGIVAGYVLQRIPGECVAAVIIDCLDRRGREKHQSLAGCHSCNFICYACSESIEEKPLERMVVESAESVGDVKAVVPGVKCCWLIVRPDEQETSTTLQAYCITTYSCAWHDGENIATYPQ